MTEIEVEPFDPAQPRGSLGHQVHMRNLHEQELDALRRLVAAASAAGLIADAEVWAFRALDFRLESMLQAEQAAVDFASETELERLQRVRSAP